MQHNFDDFLLNCLIDVAVKLQEQIGENFRRGAFYGQPWKGKSNYPGAKQKLLYRHGILQESVDVDADPAAKTITARSTVAYASLHNEGGVVVVTGKMKRFFWYMHKKALGSLATKKDGTTRANRRNMAINAEAEYWKGLALMPVGKRLHMPERRFVGPHPQLDKAIKQIVTTNLNEAAAALAQQMQQQANRPA